MTNLHTIIIANRKNNKALALDDFGNKDMLNAWKDACAKLLSAISDYATANRNNSPEEIRTNATNDAFAAWRTVLKFFEDKSEGFKLRPEAHDVQAISDFAGNYGVEHNDAWKVAHAELTAARKARKEAEADESATDADIDAANKAVETAEKNMATVKEKTGHTWYEFKPVSDTVFRRGLENFIADRCEKRLAKSYDEIRAEKAEANRKTKEKQKAQKKTAAKDANRKAIADATKETATKQDTKDETTAA